MKISESISNQAVDGLKSQTPEANQKIDQQSKRVDKLAGNNDNQEQNEKKAKEVTKENVKEAVEKLNDTVQPFHEDLQFEVHESSGRMMTKLVNLKKHEVIKEIPPKEILDTLGRIRKFVGLVLDEKI